MHTEHDIDGTTARGYIAATVGAIGGLVAGALAPQLPILLASRGCESWDGLGWLLLATAVAALGGLIGFTLGCYAALRVHRHAKAGPTAWLALGLGLGSLAAAGAVAGISPVPPVGAALGGAAVLAVPAMPALARHIVLARLDAKEVVS